MRRSLIVLLTAMNLRAAGSYSSALSSTLPKLSWPPSTRILPLELFNAVAVEPIRAAAILPAGENAPVASSKISAPLSTLPVRVSEKFLIAAAPLKPPSSITWVADSDAADAPARLDAAPPVATNCPADGSKNSAVARLRFDASAPPAINTSPAAGIAALIESSATNPSWGGGSVLSPLMHPLAATRPISPTRLNAASALRAHRGLVCRYSCKRIRLLELVIHPLKVAAFAGIRWA